MLFLRQYTVTWTQINAPFFLDGPAGKGKIFLWSNVEHTMCGKGGSVTPVVSTGNFVRRQNHSPYVQDTSAIECNFNVKL
jgi:hypothetical protein